MSDDMGVGSTHNIDLDRTLTKLNDFAYHHGLGKKCYQKAWVENKKLMAEFTQTPKKFLFWALKPEIAKTQVWVYLDDDYKPIPRALNEHTVVVFND